MKTIELSIQPQRSALMQGHNTVIRALIRVQAPDAPAKDHKRSPLNLALVLDRSGSMNGQPIEEAKRCASFIVDSLDEQDRASVVIYDNEVDVLFPPVAVSNKAELNAAISRVRSRGMTNLFAGWETGAQQAQTAATSEMLSRVLLLSDGCANQGLTETSEIARYCNEMADKGISTSTYGLSHHFNEELMTEMARAGQGQAYYGESAEDLIDPFREEFDLLSALCARKVMLKLQAAPGVSVDVLNKYAVNESGNYQLPDLAYGGEVWALVKLVVPANIAEGTALLSAQVSANNLEGEAMEGITTTLSLPSVPAETWQSIAEDELVVARQKEIRAAQLQEQARNAANQGDWQQVDQLLAQAEAETGDNPWIKEALASLKNYARRREARRFSKESHYKSAKMRGRVASKAEMVDAYSADAELEMPSFLRRKPEQGKKL